MINTKYFVITTMLMLFNLASCTKKADNKAKSESKPIKSMELDYATGFAVDYYEDYKLVTVKRPFMKSESPITYKLSYSASTDSEVISIPLEKIVCTSTTHIPLLDYLEETNSLVGFPTTDYISSTKTRARIDSGYVQELGVDKEMNIEKLVAIDPDMVMGYTISGDFGQFDKIQQLGIPVVINAEYLEEHPLGRAEWIKFVAAFYNKEALADSIFDQIKEKYLNLRREITHKSSFPSVLSGVVYGDTWYMPGGRNYASRLINDAGAHYLWSADSTSGFLELSFEAVYDKAHQADFWVGVASFELLQDMEDADSRYADFEAFQKGNVYTNNWRKGAKGGSEFLELGYLRPDLILADLIKIFHPKVLPEYELYFHKRLE